MSDMSTVTTSSAVSADPSSLSPHHLGHAPREQAASDSPAPRAHDGLVQQAEAVQRALGARASLLGQGEEELLHGLAAAAGVVPWATGWP